MEFKNLAFEMETSSVKSDGTFKGMASTFGGQPDSWGDIVEPGAFLKTLNKGGRSGNGILMLKFHDKKLIPGHWLSIMENKRGLAVHGQTIETTLGKDTFIELRTKSVQGLSIGFNSMKERYEYPKEKRPIRYLEEIELFEISIVGFPANVHANVTSVKSALEMAMTEREVEIALRESGVSIAAAQYILGHINLDVESVDLRDVEPGEGKPFANEHACRLEPPAKFVKFARKNKFDRVDGKRIDAIIGIKADGKSEVQSLRYPKKVWEASAAKSHCKGKGGTFEAAKGKKEAGELFSPEDLKEIQEMAQNICLGMELARLHK